jgi:hypothetical protein
MISLKPKPEPVEPDQLREHVLRTYFSLRYGIATVGIALPLVLWFGGQYGAGIPLRDSMSAYYYAEGPLGQGMRDWFVGGLFLVGGCLYLYKGFSRAENYLLNAAGIFAVLVALVPAKWEEGGKSFGSEYHNYFAIGFFLCIAAVATFCAEETLSLLSESAGNKLKHTYRGIGVLMFVSMVAAALIDDQRWKFWVEICGVFCFAAYWWIKSVELGKSEAQGEALQKKLEKKNEKVEFVTRRTLIRKATTT